MKKVLFIFLCVGVIIISACGESTSAINESVLPTVPSNYANLTNPLSTDAAIAGGEIFQSTCATCHGSGGHGDGPAGAALNPPPKDLSVLQLQVSDGYLFWRISEGSPGTAMVAWRGILTDEQIWQLTAYIRTLK
ncbi:MAG: c-type cytochrome [Anaerolineales bacterium]|nr:c-type cytochrome [Anaerolineales bacterium]MBX3037705.1 c-type cytochrome [Anaerolineales bacterium]